MILRIVLTSWCTVGNHVLLILHTSSLLSFPEHLLISIASLYIRSFFLPHPHIKSLTTVLNVDHTLFLDEHHYACIRSVNRVNSPCCMTAIARSLNRTRPDHDKMNPQDVLTWEPQKRLDLSIHWTHNTRT